jgi:exopolysaccharide biosynthesis polyprenyl glycosylphosphotransferase
MIGRKGAYRRTLLLLAGDILIIPFSYLGGYYIRFGRFTGFDEIIPLPFLAPILISYILVYYFFDLYEPRKSYWNLTSASNIFIGTLLAAIISSFLKYGLFLFPIGRGILLLANSGIFLLIFAWRNICHQMLKRLITPKRLLVVGAGKTGIEIAETVSASSDFFHVVGFLDEKRERSSEPSADFKWEVLGTPEEAAVIAEKHNIDQIVIADPAKQTAQLTQKLLDARLKGAEIIDSTEVYLLLKGKIPINFIQAEWFIKAKGFGLSEKNIMIKVKRIIDMIFSSLFLILSLPFWLIIAIAIKINSKGPIFYKQERIGKNEAPFFLYKFRSMIDKAENGKALWADENDKRITLVGKLIRKLHMDELPQLYNVIRGEMSLVGPRPERPEFVKDLKNEIPYYSLRHFIKPGLTGWAQVNFPYASSLEDSHEKLEYDLFYISHITLLLDLRVLFKTAKNLLPKRKS